MKKIIYKVIFCLSIGLSSTSCNSFLEIKPLTEIPAEGALTNAKNVESVLSSGYNNLTGGSFLGNRLPIYSELSSDNVALDEIIISSTDFTGQVAFRNVNILNKDVDGLWQTGYTAIARANAVIDAVDKGTITDGTSQAIQKTWKAEALFIRAVAHFELVRMFAKPFSANNGNNPGVPLRIKYLIAEEKAPRASVSEIYNQIIADLTASSNDLAVVTTTNRANKWVAKAYLARVYFNKMDYNNAFTIATDIVTNGGFSLPNLTVALDGKVSPLYASFRNVGNVAPTNGVIWQIVNGGNSFNDYRPGSNRYSLSANLKSAFEGSLSVLTLPLRDVRADTNGLKSVAVRNFSKKWDANSMNIPVIRLAEILLIHSESAAELNNLAAAAFSYNIVRRSSVQDITPRTTTPPYVPVIYTPITFSSQTQAITEIRKERRIELSFEGDRFHELRRQRTASMSGITNLRPAVAFDDRTLLLPIPVSETSGNSAIVQN